MLATPAICLCPRYAVSGTDVAQDYTKNVFDRDYVEYNDNIAALELQVRFVECNARY